MNESQHARIATWLGTGSINIFGPPFSGKDTQARRLAELFGGVTIGGGDIFRHAQADHELQRAMEQGGLANSDTFLATVPPFFANKEFHGKPLMLSSVGRLMAEAPTVVEATQASGHPLKAVILLSMPTSVVWEHFDIAMKEHDRGQRADDTPEALNVRIKKFADTAPVLDFYRSQGLLYEVDGTRPIETVTQEIIDVLDMLARRRSD